MSRTVAKVSKPCSSKIPWYSEIPNSAKITSKPSAIRANSTNGVGGRKVGGMLVPLVAFRRVRFLVPAPVQINAHTFSTIRQLGSSLRTLHAVCGVVVDDRSLRVCRSAPEGCETAFWVEVRNTPV